MAGIVLNGRTASNQDAEEGMGGAGLIHTNIHLGHWYSTNR